MKPFEYISVCSGIEAATVAWHGLGWRPRLFAEVAKFPSAVLAHHYPEVPNIGDFTQIQGDEYRSIDALVGGTPCQDFSVAGLRAGMDGARGQLTIEYARLAERIRPRWLVWENVPGVLSIDGGRAFGTFLGLLGQLGYGFAYRVLDAQHFGVPQRRRRVFVVGYLGDWRRAAAVLFERHSLQGHPAPSREARQVASRIPSRSLGGGGLGTDFDCDGGLICGTLNANGKAAGSATRQDAETGMLITHALRGEGFDASEDGTGRGTPLVPVTAVTLKACAKLGGFSNSADHAAAGYMIPIAFSAKDHGADAMNDCAPTLRAGGHTSSHANAGVMPAVAISTNQRCEARLRDVHGSLNGSKSGKQFDGVITNMAVRRLTPRECERLQGFPDDYTLISPKTADGPRYKALGNSMAVPVMRWIGERIAMVDALPF